MKRTNEKWRNNFRNYADKNYFDWGYDSGESLERYIARLLKREKDKVVRELRDKLLPMALLTKDDDIMEFTLIVCKYINEQYLSSYKKRSDDK